MSTSLYKGIKEQELGTERAKTIGVCPEIKGGAGFTTEVK